MDRFGRLFDEPQQGDGSRGERTRLGAFYNVVDRQIAVFGVVFECRPVLQRTAPGANVTESAA